MSMFACFGFYASKLRLLFFLEKKPIKPLASRSATSVQLFIPLRLINGQLVPPLSPSQTLRSVRAGDPHLPYGLLCLSPLCRPVSKLPVLPTALIHTPYGVQTPADINIKNKAFSHLIISSFPSPCGEGQGGVTSFRHGKSPWFWS